jgi:phenolic acid decarboxylase
MTANIDEVLPPQDLTGVIGRRFVYVYANGWQYEIYVKNATTIDYLIHSGMVGGRRVKDQHVDLVMLTDGIYKVSWNEPTGTSVSVTLLPAQRLVHGVIFFPRWVKEHPERTVVFQNAHLDRMREYRDRGPTYPIETVAEFARIVVVEDVGPDNEDVITSGT